MGHARTGDMIGTIVEERYLVEAELGNGAMGRVYAARHVKVGRQVAIKVMHDELARNALIVERFAREALVAARLRHPNLVSVLDVGSAPDGRPLIVLELAPGIPLSEITGALEQARVVGLIRQLLCGLEHAHAAGLIHRDLKPDNILVETTADGTEIPRIVDFGIAIDNTGSTRRLTEANIVIGTPFYMSPEQARAKKIDHRSDLFSLGVIMYELLAGMPPFPGTSVEVALANTSREPPSIYERAGIVIDPLLETFARRLMARQLSDRFGSAREALNVLALIERDRLSAARALAARANEPAVVVVEEVATVEPEVPASELANTDAMTTLVDVEPETHVGTWDEAADATGARTVVRRRKRFAVAIATSAMVMLAAVGFAARGEHADVPRAEVNVGEPIAMHERVSVNETSDREVRERASMNETIDRGVMRESAPVNVTAVRDVPNVKMKREKADRQIVELLAMTKVSTPQKAVEMTRASTTQEPVAMTSASKPVYMTSAPMTPVAMTSLASTLPVAVQPAVVDSPVRASADVVVAKYVAIGKALKTAKRDELWAKYRLIRINDAIATADGRRNTLVTLAAIEMQIAQ